MYGLDKYIKAIINGDIIEFYVSDRSPNIEKVEKGSDDGIFAEEITNFEDRKEERRKQTLRDSKNLMRRLANRNFEPEKSLFITLTYRDHMTFADLDLADRHFRIFIDSLREETGQAFHYIAVREFTKKGRIHFHLITDFKIDGDLYEGSVDLMRWERDVASVWGQGFVDIKLINHVDNVGAYLSKYMSKEIDCGLFINKKYYLCSKGLKRPDVVTGKVAFDLFNALRDKKEVFTNSYESEYLGTITYFEYNLKRIRECTTSIS